MNIADINSLKEDCGFITVDSHPSGDDYGAMTVVQLTDAQVKVWNQLDSIEIKCRVSQSENYVRLGLKMPYYVKSPEILRRENIIYFHGSQVVAAVFFHNVFC